MRKVFISMMLLQDLKPTEYVSEDFSIVNDKFMFPMTYIIADNIKAGETVTVITGVEKKIGEFQKAVENYAVYQDEVKRVTEERNGKVEFVELWLDKDFDSATFNRFFREAANCIQENDVIYYDITFGMKPYTISLFVALNYVVKACENVEVNAVIYAQKFSGSTEAANADKSVIYDLTGLFYLNELAGNICEGDREGADKMLDFIIGHEK